MKTDHSADIERLRTQQEPAAAVLADLLEIHDQTGLSLDNWSSAQDLAKQYDVEIVPNGV